jgi:hypothetical protein
LFAVVVVCCIFHSNVLDLFFAGLKKLKQKEQKESKNKRNILSRQLSQSGRNVTRISHEYYEDLQSKRDAMANEKSRQKGNMIMKKKSLKEAAKSIAVVSSMGRRTRRTRGKRHRMSVFEKQQAKARERQQLQRELSNNWGKLQNAAGTVVNARKEKIKARIRKREERMRIENIDRVVNRDMKRESKKLRAKALNRTMFMATVLLMVSRDDGKGCSVVCDEWFSHFMNLEFLLFSFSLFLFFSFSLFLFFSFSLFLFFFRCS